MIRWKYYLIHLLLAAPAAYLMIWVVIWVSWGLHAVSDCVEKRIASPIWQYFWVDFSVHRYQVLALIAVYILVSAFLYKTELKRVGWFETARTTLRIARRVFSTAFRWISVPLEFTAHRIGETFKGVFSFENSIRIRPQLIPGNVRRIFKAGDDLSDPPI